MTPTHVLLVGSGGLLGSGVGRELGRRGVRVVRAVVPWRQADAAVGALRAAADETDRVSGGDWTLAWCAGSGVVGADPEIFESELSTLGGLVEHLVRPGAARPRAVFYASSAGGVYGGSDGPPFTEETAPRPLGSYGHAKLRAEGVVARLATTTPVVVGRIANLYGPGQDMSKSQGLISRLCLSYLTGQPIGVYVSLDTLRDYVYVEDCARLVVDALDRAALGTDDVVAPVVKILASQQPVSIAHVLGECRRVFGRRVPVRMASSPLASQQARDLRLRSVVWPELDRRELTTLVHGIHATAESLRVRLGDVRAL